MAFHMTQYRRIYHRNLEEDLEVKLMFKTRDIPMLNMQLIYYLIGISALQNETSSCPKMLATVARRSSQFRGGAAGDETMFVP